MRKLSVLLCLVIVGFTGNALAHDCYAVPYYVSESPGWYEYNPNDLTTWADYDCWTKDSYVALCTLDCFPSVHGFCSTALYQHMTHTFTVGDTDSGTSSWVLTWKYELLSPGGWWMDQVGVTVSVVHGGYTTTYSTSHNGTQGGVYCRNGTLNFTAYNGDRITVDFDLERSDPSSRAALSAVHIRRHAS